MLFLASCGSLKTKTATLQDSQDQLILATLWYQKSAEMQALYFQCYNNAMTSVQKNLAASDKSKPAAVVLDIDETVLDNSPFQGWQVFEKKGFNDEDWNRWVSLAAAKPLPGALQFTRFADSLGVEVFYVSNRKVSEVAPTLKNMQALGFPDADDEHLLLKETTSSKVERRAAIERNYEIILLIGDNLADLDGVFEKRTERFSVDEVTSMKDLFGTRYIILSNPMYGTWLNEMLKRAEGETHREKLLNLLQGF